MSADSIALFVSSPLLLDCLRGQLLREGWNVIVASSRGEGARAAVVEFRPTISVVSLRLPPLGGIHVIGTLADARADLLIVALLDPGTSDDGFRALQSGALSWMSTDHGWEAGHRTLRAAAVGDVHLSGELPGRPNRNDPEPALSRREFQVLNLVSCGHGVKQIAEDLVISHKTVKHHLASIHAKLGVHSRTDAVLRAFRTGLLDSTRLGPPQPGSAQASGSSETGAPSPFSP